MGSQPLAVAYEELHAEATTLAGRLGDLARRAATYRHLFQASQGNHAFPLIAAHGAMWAGGQFRFGLKLGRWLAWQYAWSANTRKKQLQRLADFFDALREINRRVCVDSYVQFYLSKRFQTHPEITKFVPANLFGSLCTVHDACRRGESLTDEQRREVFVAHFLHEQETIVGKTLETAVEQFAWPLVRFFALRPRVRFAYLPGQAPIVFHNFADKQERIRNGLSAFDAAAIAGWRHVEQSLETYGVFTAAERGIGVRLEA